MASVLALQPWDAGSHHAVRRSIERHGSLRWRFETMAGRSPRWRLRHAGLAFAERLHRVAPGSVDAVFATGMMSLADFRAAAPRVVRDLPHVLYMHENQAAYPESPNADRVDRRRDAHLAFTNLASIETADRVVWNSAWNRDSFVAGLREILTHAPESIGTGWVDRLHRKSVVVPPPVEPADHMGCGVLHNRDRPGYPDRPEVLVAWPHRWEFDKGCESFLGLADRAASLESRGGPRLRWCLLGHRGANPPEAMTTFLTRHADRIRHAGWIADRADYRATLAQCDWVLSTSRHEFFGIAVAEALLEGCLPWLPKRLSYPELVPEEAFELDPWTMPEETRRTPAQQTQVARVSEGIRARLDAAIAPHAVGRLESEIHRAMDGGSEPTFGDGSDR